MSNFKEKIKHFIKNLNNLSNKDAKYRFDLGEFDNENKFHYTTNNGNDVSGYWGLLFGDFTNMNEQEKRKFAKKFSEGSSELEELLLFFWNNGLNTRACCAGHNFYRVIPYVSLPVDNVEDETLYKIIKSAIKTQNMEVELVKNRREISGCENILDVKVQFKKFTTVLSDKELKSSRAVFSKFLKNLQKELTQEFSSFHDNDIAKDMVGLKRAKMNEPLQSADLYGAVVDQIYLQVDSHNNAFLNFLTDSIYVEDEETGDCFVFSDDYNEIFLMSKNEIAKKKLLKVDSNLDCPLYRDENSIFKKKMIPYSKELLKSVLQNKPVNENLLECD